MRRIAAGLLLALSMLWLPPALQAQSRLSPGFAAGEAGLTPSERAGREIWFFATAGNDRFHTYVFPQRLGAAIDWYGILNADNRDRRFRTWGLINDPDCCVPGSAGLPCHQPRADLWLRLVPRRRGPSGACRQDRLPRSGLRLRGRAMDARRPAR